MSFIFVPPVASPPVPIPVPQVAFGSGASITSSAKLNFDAATNTLYDATAAGVVDIAGVDSATGLKAVVSAQGGQAAAGGAVALTGGAGLAGNPGGAASVTSGAGQGIGDGGTVSVTGGNGGATGGLGGPINVVAGNGGTGNNGGPIAITGGTGGAGGGAAPGGDVAVRGGPSSTSLGGLVSLTSGRYSVNNNAGALIRATGASVAKGGSIELLAGRALAGNGGDAQLVAGQGDTTAGGAVTVTGGISLAAAGGALTMAGGLGSTTGGPVSITGGATAAAAAGANVNITPGAGSTSIKGTINLNGVSVQSLNASALPAPPTSSILQIANADGTDSDVVLDAFGTGRPIFLTRKARTSAAAPSAVQTNDQLGEFRVQGYGTTSFSGGMYLQGVATENWTDAARGSKAEILTTANGTNVQTVAFAVNQDSTVSVTSKIYPGSDAGAAQLNTGLFGNVGAPNNANGNNGDFYFRSDGGALTTIYQRRAGAWVGII